MTSPGRGRDRTEWAEKEQRLRYHITRISSPITNTPIILADRLRSRARSSPTVAAPLLQRATPRRFTCERLSLQTL